MNIHTPDFIGIDYLGRVCTGYDDLHQGAYQPIGRLQKRNNRLKAINSEPYPIVNQSERAVLAKIMIERWTRYLENNLP